MEYKTIIDSSGNIVDLCVMFINDKAQYFKMQEGQQAVERYAKNYIKPRWDGSEWVESATEEEILAWENKHKANSEGVTTEDRIDELEASLAELSMTLAQKGVL